MSESESVLHAQSKVLTRLLASQGVDPDDFLNRADYTTVSEWLRDLEGVAARAMALGAPGLKKLYEEWQVADAKLRGLPKPEHVQERERRRDDESHALVQLVLDIHAKLEVRYPAAKNWHRAKKIAARVFHVHKRTVMRRLADTGIREPSTKPVK